MMFESSQFDSPAGAGFISTQTADPSPASAKSRDAQPMYSATVKQIVEAIPSSDDKSNFLIDGVIVSNVKTIGMVFDKSVRVTDVSFVIDDGTGHIGCTRWVNDSQDCQEVEELTDGIYVRVHGLLKNYQGKKQVVVYAIRPVNDHNEISTHFLECIHAHCSNNKLQNTGSDTPASSNSSTPNNGQQAVSSSQVSQIYNLDGLGSIDKLVLDHLQYLHPCKSFGSAYCEDYGEEDRSSKIQEITTHLTFIYRLIERILFVMKIYIFRSCLNLLISRSLLQISRNLV